MNLGAMLMGRLSEAINWGNSASFRTPQCDPWVGLVSAESESVKSNDSVVESVPTIVAEQPIEVDSQERIAKEASLAEAEAMAQPNAKPSAAQEAAAQEAAAQEAAALEAAAKEAAAKEIAKQEAAANEAASKEIAARAAVAKEANENEIATQAAAAKEAAEKEAAEKEIFAKEAAAKLALANEAAAKDAAKAEAAKIEAAHEAAAIEAARAEALAIQSAAQQSAAQQAAAMVASAKAPAPITRSTEPAKSVATMGASVGMTAVRSMPPIPTLDSHRTQRTDTALDDYLGKLERLVLELNMELGRRKDQSPTDPIEQLSHRIIELNLENMALRERLELAASTKELQTINESTGR